MPKRERRRGTPRRLRWGEPYFIIVAYLLALMLLQVWPGAATAVLMLICARLVYVMLGW